MIFLGDIAHPFGTKANWGHFSSLWNDQPVVVNLEGAIATGEMAEQYLKHKLVFNHESIVDTFREVNVQALSLSNNHITDVPFGIENTIKILKKEKIAAFGAGNNTEEARSPAIIDEGDRRFLLLGCGWNVIQCRYGDSKSAGVNSIDGKNILNTVSSLRHKHPKATIVLMPHWNYEMELYPQPAHRRLAMDAIDCGANAVIGHHSHCVGGIEFYKKSPIVYSLGNWWFPQGVFFNGRLSFKDESLLQLALEWNGDERMTCHWFRYERNGHSIVHESSENVFESPRRKELTPFEDMSHTTYCAWFKKHRVKKLALPIYRSYDASIINWMKDIYVAWRQVGVVLIKKMK